MFSLICHPSLFELENVMGAIETVRVFCQAHFPQIIPFMVDWLRTVHCRFPYLTWGAAGE